MPLRATFNGGGLSLSASFGNTDTLDACLNSTVYVPELYEGPYDVTPSESVQTLPTQGFGMAQNVTVQPIPSEYIVPSGTVNITENGIADVGQYENADIGVVDNFQWGWGRYY